MKFKDLKIGQKFRMTGWHEDVVGQKIEPYTKTSEDGKYTLTFTFTANGARQSWIEPDDDVELL